MASRYEELTLKKRQVGAEIEKLRGQMRAMAQEMDTIAVEEQVRLKVESMSDPERRRLAQALQAKGVESGEAVGTPGAVG